MNKTSNFTHISNDCIKERVQLYLISVGIYDNIDDIDSDVAEVLKNKGTLIEDSIYSQLNEIVDDVNIAGEFNREDIVEYILTLE